MALDGIMFEGVSVRVRRPNDYNPAAAAALGPSVPNPALNLGAIGLQPGGMGAQVTPMKPKQICIIVSSTLPSTWGCNQGTWAVINSPETLDKTLSTNSSC